MQLNHLIDKELRLVSKLNKYGGEDHAPAVGNTEPAKERTIDTRKIGNPADVTGSATVRD